MKEEKAIVKTKREKKKVVEKCKKEYHILEEKETRWSLMKKYGISEEEITELNPNLKGKWLKIKKGDIIRIK